MPPPAFSINVVCFTRNDENRRQCNICTSSFAASASVDSLKHHWHSAHPHEAKAMGVPLPSSKRKAPSSSHFSSSLHSHFAVPAAVVVSDVGSFIDSSRSFLVEHDPPIERGSSSASSLASASSSVSSLRSLNSRRIYADPLPTVSKRRKQNDIREYDSTLLQYTEQSLAAQVDFFLYEGVSLRLADSPYLREWLQLYAKGLGA
jgi:hypothetical protein